MVAYVAVIREWSWDNSQDAAYQQKARAASASHPLTVRAFRGRFKVVEGDPIEAIALLEFPSYEEAVAWYESPEYQEALELRRKGGEYRAIIIEGE